MDKKKYCKSTNVCIAVQKKEKLHNPAPKNKLYFVVHAHELRTTL